MRRRTPRARPSILAIGSCIQEMESNVLASKPDQERAVDLMPEPCL